MKPKIFVKATWFGLLIAGCMNGYSQTITMKAAFDSSSILIGDQVKLRMEFDQPPKAVFLLPVFNDTITGQIKIVKSFPPDTVKSGDHLHIRKEYLVTSFDSGSHRVPPIAFPFQIGQLKDTLHSSELVIKVNSLPVDTTKDFRDVKPPLKAPVTLAEIWPYLLIGFGICCIVILVIWYFMVYRKKDKIAGFKKNLEPPHIIALRELDSLRGEKIWQTGKQKLYYTRLTEIIRVYIEQRFGIYALEMTSDEILQALNVILLEEKASIELLRNMFFTADWVKFAKGNPLPDENEISMLNAYQFVNNTKPVASTIEASTENQTESNQ